MSRSPTHLMNQPVTILIRTDSGTEDTHGDPIYDESELETVGFLSRQRHSEAPDTGLQSEQFTLFVPAATTATGWDGVRALGATYEIVGPPTPAYNARSGQASHLEATISRTF